MNGSFVFITRNSLNYKIPNPFKFLKKISSVFRVKNRTTHRESRKYIASVIPIVQLIIRMQIILDPQGYQLLISHRRISSKQKKKSILLLLRGDTSVICLLLFSSVNFFPIPPPNPTFSPIPQRDLSYTTRMSTVKRAEHFARDAFRGSFRRPRGGFYLSARTRAARLCAGSSAGFQGRP